MEDSVTSGVQDTRGADWYRTLVEDVDDLITVVDPDGTITYVSPAVTRTLGYDPDELTGHTGYEFVHPGDRERNAEAIDAVLSDPSDLKPVGSDSGTQTVRGTGSRPQCGTDSTTTPSTGFLSSGLL